MNSHVSAILLGVRDMERSKSFYTEGLGWEVQDDWRISVFFVPHGIDRAQGEGQPYAEDA